MGARVTPSDVKEIVSTSISDDVVLANMIDTANAIIDEHLQAKGLSPRILTKIEQYLAAHFVAITEERGGLIRSSFGVGDVEEEMSDVYQGGFHSTRYGQQAMGLDTTGTLVRIGSTRLKAEITVV